MIICFLVAGFLFGLFAMPVHAEVVCGDRDQIIERLQSVYKEHAIGAGLAGGGHVVEIFRSDSGTWTMLITKPGGETCLVAAGEAWEDMAALPGGPVL